MADLLKAVVSAEFTGQQAFDKAAAAANKTEAAFKKLVPGANQANQSMVNLSRVVQDAPFGFIGIANNIDPLLQSFQSLKRETGSSKEAFKALGSSLLGGGGLALGVSLVTSALVVFGDKLFSSGKAAKEAKSAADSLKESITGIFSSQAKEAAEVTGFVAIIKSETETRERKLAAIKELQRIQPEVFANLKLEGNAVVGLDAAYASYLENLKTVIAVKIKQAQLEQKIAELLKAQGVTLTESEKKVTNFVKAVQDNITNRAKQAGGAEGLSYVESIFGKEAKRKQDENKLKGDIDGLLKDITGLSKGIKVDQIKVKPEKIDFDSQFAKIVYLSKPIPVQGRIFDFNVAQEGTDLLKKVEYEFGDRLKSMEKLVVAPKLNLSQSIKEGNEKLLESFNQIKRLAETVAGSVSSAFSNAFGEIARGANVFQTLGNAIKGVVVDLIQAAIKGLIFKAVMNLILPGSGSATAGIGSLLGSFGGFRAGGGPVGAGRSYIVGENGPELFTPGISGNIIPNGRLGSMGGSFGGLQVSGYLTGRGNDLVAVIAAANRSQGRLG